MEVTNDNDEVTNNSEIVETNKTTFKKPILIGKIGRLPRKMVSVKANVDENNKKEENNINAENDEKESIEDLEANEKPFESPAQLLIENSLVLPYKEPDWSGLPPKSNKEYTFEVLKSGVIVEQIDLTSKSFWVFGRSVNSDIYMAHPTISRYHAVLQYRIKGTEKDPPGFYIYDLNSTHGTFLNKGKLKSKVYAPVKVGHMLKLGFSTRSYVLTGPDEDKEEESELSLTELKQKRAEKLLKEEMELKAAIVREEQEKEERRRRYEERGVDWGLGEDADEEADVTENPFAETNNEELYIDDPKKALRGFMEREGYSLDYDCIEQGFGQFLCKVELPLDDDHGRRIIAEVLHKGKKKEAVVQCALEACKILDRYGVLRQAVHESRKRKARNWEENDYYDSDDDTFLDRTGTVEKKREKRMNSKIPQQPETYQSLLEKEKTISNQIVEIEKQLSTAKLQSDKSETSEEDSLDLFMRDLKHSRPDKQTISKLKSDLAVLKSEHVNIVNLVNLVKPADLPALISQHTHNTNQTTSSVSKPNIPIFGKRKKLKIEPPQRSSTVPENESDEDEEKEESDLPATDCSSTSHENDIDVKTVSLQNKEKHAINSESVPWYVKIYRKVTELETIMGVKSFSPGIDNCISQISEVLFEIKNVIEEDGKLQMDKNLIVAKNRKVKKHIDNLMESFDDSHLLRICKELKRLYSDIQNMTVMQYEVFSKIRVLAVKIDLISKEVTKQMNAYKEEDIKKTLRTAPHNEDLLQIEEEDNDKSVTIEELERRRKKNQKRNQHRKEKNEIEKQKGYKEDAQKEDYNMWIPPENQTGDGRTTLNEKYGY